MVTRIVLCPNQGTITVTSLMILGIPGTPEIEIEVEIGTMIDAAQGIACKAWLALPLQILRATSMNIIVNKADIRPQTETMYNQPVYLINILQPRIDTRGIPEITGTPEKPGILEILETLGSAGSRKGRPALGPTTTVPWRNEFVI